MKNVNAANPQRINSVGKLPELPAIKAASLNPEGKKKSIIIAPLVFDDSQNDKAPLIIALSINIHKARKNTFINPPKKHENHNDIATKSVASKVKNMKTCKMEPNE